MQVLTEEQQMLFDALLKLAGDSDLLEMALLRTRSDLGEKAELQDIIRNIFLLKREAATATGLERR